MAAYLPVEVVNIILEMRQEMDAAEEKRLAKMRDDVQAELRKVIVLAGYQYMLCMMGERDVGLNIDHPGTLYAMKAICASRLNVCVKDVMRFIK